ncbi:MAG TPA: hypothetical protein VGL87_14955 [Steroidobacteraceae bacterium]
MYLVDTDVISEIRKGDKANPGVRAFFADTSRESVDLYLSVVTIGELRQGVERIRHRGDDAQAKRLGRWLEQVTTRRPAHGYSIHLRSRPPCGQNRDSANFPRFQRYSPIDLRIHHIEV